MDLEKRLRAAVQSYWDARSKNKEKQIEGGKIDAGTRGEVTGASQMGAMEVLVADILCQAELNKIDVKSNKEPYFKVNPVFDKASYSRRYELLCRRLVRERVYSSARLVMATNSPRTKLTPAN